MNLANEQTPPEGDQSLAVKQEVKREVFEFVKMVLWFLLLFFGLRAYVVEGYEIQGPSMQPTLQDRERILVFKLPLELGMDAIHPGDIVVFKSPDDPGKRYVKRVIAKGPHLDRRHTADAQQIGGNKDNDVKVLFDHGHVYVDNRMVNENYLPPRMIDENETGEEADLGPGDYYVLGDNRPKSKDSRIFGPITEDAIIGKAVLRFWPPSRFGLLK